MVVDRRDHDPTPIMTKEKVLSYRLLSCVGKENKQNFRSGAIKQPVEIALWFLCVCFLRQKVSTPKKFSLLLFLKNGLVLYSFKNKAYLKP